MYLTIKLLLKIYSTLIFYLNRTYSMSHSFPWGDSLMAKCWSSKSATWVRFLLSSIFIVFFLKSFTFAIWNNFFFIIHNVLFFILNFFINFYKNNSSTKTAPDFSSYTHIFKKWFFLQNNYMYTLFDKFFFLLFFLVLKNNLNFQLNRSFFRLKQTHLGFYISFTNNQQKNILQNFFSQLFAGLKYVWLSFRFWVVGLLLALVIVYYSMYIRSLSFSKFVFEWIILIMFWYWLVSGFTFFIKKYQYSKFTSSTQRFWKRAFTYFWLLEITLFTLYLYLTLNASQEPNFMYDQIAVFKTHLFSWRWFLLKLIPVVALIIIGYVALLSLKWNLFAKNSALLLALTLILLYAVWLEFYQFFHIVNFYGNLVWNFDYDENLWTLDIESRKTRILNNYVSLCFMLKFWHLIFIFLFWVFFVLRVNEIKRVRYPLFSANLQNFLILYILSWIYMYPWLKFIVKHFMNYTYYWFYTNTRSLGLRVFLTDIKLVFFGLLDARNGLQFNFLTFFTEMPFFYWIENSSLTNFYNFSKSSIKDYFILNISESFFQKYTHIKSINFFIFL